MKGFSYPGSLPSDGFKETGNSEQYAFKEANIKGMGQSNLYVPNFLMPAGGAMSITEHWHADVFRPVLLLNI